MIKSPHQFESHPLLNAGNIVSVLLNQKGELTMEKLNLDSKALAKFASKLTNIGGSEVSAKIYPPSISAKIYPPSISAKIYPPRVGA